MSRDENWSEALESAGPAAWLGLRDALEIPAPKIMTPSHETQPENTTGEEEEEFIPEG
jgi:hypothetical protein